jgi:catechol 2,3-dioxygenase
MHNSLVAHLAHVEVVTPKLDESLAFYQDILGLEEVGRDDTSIYLRAWGDWYRHSLQLTEGPQPAVGHAAWRMTSQEALDEAARRMEERGVGLGWTGPSFGHGDAYRFTGPSGHVQELFWEVERFDTPADQRSPMGNRPQRMSARGASVRRIDHYTINSFGPTEEAQWYCDLLGFRFMERTVLDDDNSKTIGAFISSVGNSHELGMILDFSGLRTEPRVEGRANHVAYWLDSREDVLRAADIVVESGGKIEFGPGRHGIGENFFLYIREPGGMRVELFSGGYINAVPDWEPAINQASFGLSYWNPDQRAPEAFLVEAFPPIETTRPSDA